MEKKLVLTTGKTTTKVEDYVLDLFTFYLSLYPGDVPHSPNMGFDFNLAGVTKDRLSTEVRVRLDNLVEKVKSKIPFSDISLELRSADLIDEERVKLSLDINGQATDDLFIDIYNR